MTGERIQHSLHPNCRCRQCRLVRFAESIEQLLKNGVPQPVQASMWPHSDSGDGLTTEEYALLFESQVRELHAELVLR